MQESPAADSLDDILGMNAAEGGLKGEWESTSLISNPCCNGEIF